MSSEGDRGSRETAPTFTRGWESGEIDALPVGTAFDVLADARRRHSLYYLIEGAGGAATAGEIADHLHESEHVAPGADREAILVDLHHRQLPRMESAGLLEYDDGDGTVRYEGDPLVEDLLARVAARDFGQRS